MDIACLLEVRILDRVHSAIKVPSAEACYYLYHSGVVDNSGRHGVAIALNKLPLKMHPWCGCQSHPILLVLA